MWFVGFVLRFVTPVKLLPVLWQVAHPVLIPVWFICVPAKLDVDLWHVAQSAVVGMCPVPCGFGVTPVKAVPVALAAWQVVQPEVMPLWFITPGTRLFGLVWHVAHAAVGRKVIGRLAPDHAAAERGRRRVAGRTIARSRVIRVLGQVGRVTIVTPKKLLPVSWQVAQPAVIPVWFICVPAKLVKLPAAWQVSQVGRRRKVVRRLGLEVRHAGEALAGVVAGRAAGGDAAVVHRRTGEARG